jgi:hypothetical protein
MLSKMIYKQRGAVEACWAHNSEVGRSKLFAAKFLLNNSKNIYPRPVLAVQ